MFSTRTLQAKRGTRYAIASTVAVGTLALAGAVPAFASASARPPLNDSLREATLISSLPFSTSEDASGATVRHNEPQPSCAHMGGTVWWQFTPASSSTLFADTIGSNFDTVLAVYTRSGNQFTQVACNDDSDPPLTLASSVSFSATSGTTYYFQAGGCCATTAIPGTDLEFSLHQ